MNALIFICGQHAHTLALECRSVMPRTTMPFHQEAAPYITPFSTAGKAMIVRSISLLRHAGYDDAALACPAGDALKRGCPTSFPLFQVRGTSMC